MERTVAGVRLTRADDGHGWIADGRTGGTVVIDSDTRGWFALYLRERISVRGGSLTRVVEGLRERNAFAAALLVG